MPWAVIVVVGTWKTLFWPAEDYLRWGFGPAVSDLDVPPLELGGRMILRGPSTRSDANELGMHLVLGMVALVQLAFWASWGRRWAIAAVGAWLGVALAVTYSRRDIIAFSVGLAVLCLAPAPDVRRLRYPPSPCTPPCGAGRGNSCGILPGISSWIIMSRTRPRRCSIW